MDLPLIRRNYLRLVAETIYKFSSKEEPNYCGSLMLSALPASLIFLWWKNNQRGNMTEDTMNYGSGFILFAADSSLIMNRRLVNGSKKIFLQRELSNILKKKLLT
jgi:hypothetical protein